MRVPGAVRGAAALLACVGAALGHATVAAATYRGLDGQIAFQAAQAYSGADGAVATEDVIETRQLTLAACRGRSGHVAPRCALGGIGYSPDGHSVVTSRGTAAGFHGVDESGGRLTIVSAQGGRPRVLAPLTGADREPAFLADGRTIVFTGQRRAGATPNLYTVSVNGRGLRRVTRDGGSAAAPCGDGRVAYEHAGAVYVLARGLRGRRLLVRHATQPSCAPDSRRIAYVHDGALYTIPTAGGPARRLIAARPGDRRPGPVRDPTWSPDGREIAYEQFVASPPTDPGDRLRIVTATGAPAPGELQVDRHGACGDSCLRGVGASRGLAWQPLRQRTAFVHRDAVPLHVGGAPVSRLAIDRSGNVVAAVTRRGSLAIIRDGSGSVSHRPAVIPGAGSGALAITADGREVAVANRAVKQLLVFGVDPATGRPHRIQAPLSTPSTITGLAFSPSGAVLAATLYDGSAQTWRVTSSGRLVAAATTPPNLVSAPLAFSPSGTHLAVGAPGDRLDSHGVRILAVNESTGALSVPAGPVIAPRAAALAHDGPPPVFTRDGRLLLGSDPGNTDLAQVFEVSSGGHTMAPVTGSPLAPPSEFTQRGTFDAAFSPDARLRAYEVVDPNFITDHQRTRLLLVPLDVGTGVGPETIGGPPSADEGTLAFSGDSRVLAVGSAGQVDLYARRVTTARG